MQRSPFALFRSRGCPRHDERAKAIGCCPHPTRLFRCSTNERKLTHARHLPATYLPYTAEHGIRPSTYRRPPSARPALSHPALHAIGAPIVSRDALRFVRPALRATPDLVPPPSPSRGLQRRERRRRALSTAPPRRRRRAREQRLPPPPHCALPG